MKRVTLLAAILLSLPIFAQTQMGPEANEMFTVLANPRVQECLANTSTRLMNLQITKATARCPFCVTYKISGNKRNIDTPSVEKTVITIKGKGVAGFGGQMTQRFECEVREN